MIQPNMTATHDVLSDRYDLNHNGAAGLREPLLPAPRHWQQAPTRGRSHHQQHPARRRNGHNMSLPLSGLNLYITIVMLISCCCSLASAAAIASTEEATAVVRAAAAEIPEKITDPLADASEELRLALAHLAKSGTIVVDTRPPPPPPGGNYWQIENVEREGLLRRQSHNSSSTASSTASSTSTQSSTSTTVAGSATTSGSAASGTASPSPLPSPFDSSLGNNFTSPSCPDFISGFLSNATFKACLPFSLLLESSQSFFQAEKSVVRITQTLDATCSANATYCDTLMQTLANNLTATSNCGADYAAQNPTVLAAHTGLMAYKPLYTASCLKNPLTSSYCFADAVTNASSPTDSYVYYLALNTSLPGGSQPTCSACLQNTMAVFDAAAANRSQPVASTYVAAAQQINVNCGPGFVNASIPAAVSAGVRGVAGGPSPLLALVTVLAVWAVGLWL